MKRHLSNICVSSYTILASLRSLCTKGKNMRLTKIRQLRSFFISKNKLSITPEKGMKTQNNIKIKTNLSFNSFMLQFFARLISLLCMVEVSYSKWQYMRWKILSYSRLSSKTGFWTSRISSHFVCVVPGHRKVLECIKRTSIAGIFFRSTFIQK